MSYRTPRDVAHVVREDAEGQPVVYLMPLPVGSPVVLRGTAAHIWLQAAEGVEDVVASMVDFFGGDPAEVSAATLPFLRDLVSRGLLEESSSPVSGQPGAVEPGDVI